MYSITFMLGYVFHYIYVGPLVHILSCNVSMLVLISTFWSVTRSFHMIHKGLVNLTISTLIKVKFNSTPYTRSCYKEKDNLNDEVYTVK